MRGHANSSLHPEPLGATRFAEKHFCAPPACAQPHGAPAAHPEPPRVVFPTFKIDFPMQYDFTSPNPGEAGSGLLAVTVQRKREKPPPEQPVLLK